jgi:hypothetical protein
MSSVVNVMHLAWESAGVHERNEQSPIRAAQQRGASPVHSEYVRTIVPGINSCEKLLVQLHELSELHHQHSSLRCREQLPRVMHKSSLGSLDGTADIARIGGVNGSNWLVSSRESILSVFTFMYEKALLQHTLGRGM